MKRSYFSLPLAVCLALSVLAFVPAVGNAGVFVQNPAVGVDTLLFLDVQYDWTFAGADPPLVPFVGSNWSFVVEPRQGVDLFGEPVVAVKLVGYHTEAPHSGELDPSNAFTGFFTFPKAANAFALLTSSVLHTDADGPDRDVWTLSALVNGAGTEAHVTVQAQHVPEPSSLALLGVGSLIGLGVYTRRRRKNA